MIDKCDLHESCIGQINDKIDAVKSDTDRMIIGLYGGLDKPNSGFANEVSQALRDMSALLNAMREKIDLLYSERKDRLDDQKKFNLGVRAAIISAVLSVLGSILVVIFGKAI
jgi:hypothetical protein